MINTYEPAAETAGQRLRPGSGTRQVTSAGGLCMAVLLYRSRLIPRPIATLGLIGYPALLAGCVLDMFNLVDVTLWDAKSRARVADQR